MAGACTQGRALRSVADSCVAAVLSPKWGSTQVKSEARFGAPSPRGFKAYKPSQDGVKERAVSSWSQTDGAAGSSLFPN